MSRYKRLSKKRENILFEQIGKSYANIIVAESKSDNLHNSEIMAPKELDNWFDDYKARKQTSRSQKYHYKFAVRALVTICLVLGILSIMVFSVDAWRIRFFNLIIDSKQNYSEISMSEKPDVINSEIPEDWNNYYYPDSLPQEYRLSETYSLKDSKIAIFNNKSGNTVQFITAGFGYKSQLDTENATIDEIMVNEEKGIIIKKGNRSTIVWSNYENTFIVISDDSNIDLMKIAKNIKKIAR